MKVLNFIGKFISLTCIFFTVPLVALMALGASSGRLVTDDITGALGIFMNVSQICSLLCFGAFLALAFAVASELMWDIFARVLLHFGISYVGFYVAFFVLVGNYSLLGSFIYLSFVYIIVYAVCAGIFLGVRAVIERRNNSKEEYEKIY